MSGSVRARVRLLVEVDLPVAWPDDVTAATFAAQAAEEARSALRGRCVVDGLEQRLEQTAVPIRVLSVDVEAIFASLRERR